MIKLQVIGLDLAKNVFQAHGIGRKPRSAPRRFRPAANPPEVTDAERKAGS
jgi:hypothetical protein